MATVHLAADSRAQDSLILQPAFRAGLCCFQPMALRSTCARQSKPRQAGPNVQRMEGPLPRPMITAVMAPRLVVRYSPIRAAAFIRALGALIEGSSKSRVTARRSWQAMAEFGFKAVQPITSLLTF